MLKRSVEGEGARISHRRAVAGVSLPRTSPGVIARERSDRSNLAVKVRGDCHPFAEFILSEAEGLRASAYSVARNDRLQGLSVFPLGDTECLVYPITPHVVNCWPQKLAKPLELTLLY